MTLNRRRFLTIAAAGLMASRAEASIRRWQGYALGAEVSLILRGPDAVTGPVLDKVLGIIGAVERQFSLYAPDSRLSVLNRIGLLAAPDPIFLRLMAAADTVHGATGGLFDPSVQPLWRAYATGGDIAAAQAALGWQRVRFDAEAIRLAPGQALTFNGIAQGFATDLVVEELHAAGLSQALVNIGEYRGLGGPWRLGISDPEAGYLGTRTLTNGANATSSPGAMQLAGRAHILHAQALPVWSTVSVEADSATMADGFSTALTMAPGDRIRPLLGRFGLRRVALVDAQGNLSTLRPR